uniref:Uncharacterized protein n=1 Tax=Podoviridae sp. ctU7u6 TaxID=2825252 RepID=A0A8S5P7K9_9CAUD|nr:MAG TPA: hypothetical protein [Podoviridae sp. ctU7u6]
MEFGASRSHHHTIQNFYKIFFELYSHICV